MKKINVIDLDKTLIPYDTFRKLVIGKVLKGDFKLIFYTILKIFNLINLRFYKKISIRHIMKKYSISDINFFSNQVAKDIDSKVMDIISKHTNIDTTNIILSASPDFYVKKIALSLGWVGQGSYFLDNGDFVHLHGNQKINWILKNYDKKKYEYNFSISDSKSDYELLDNFLKKKYWNN